MSDVTLSPAWRLKEVSASQVTTMVVYQFATYRTNEELLIWRGDGGDHTALLTGSAGQDVTDRCTQERWAQLYDKAIAAHTLLGKVPANLIETIF